MLCSCHLGPPMRLWPETLAPLLWPRRKGLTPSTLSTLCVSLACSITGPGSLSILLRESYILPPLLGLSSGNFQVALTLHQSSGSRGSLMSTKGAALPHACITWMPCPRLKCYPSSPLWGNEGRWEWCVSFFICPSISPKLVLQNTCPGDVRRDCVANKIGLPNRIFC